MLVADDHSLIREAIANRIAEADDIDVVGCVDDGRQLVTSYLALRPDLVLTDFKMPVLDGLEALAEIRAADPDAKVVMLSAFDDGKLVAQAVAAGAMGFLVKSLPSGELCARIREAARGEPVFTAEATRLMMAELRSPTRPAAGDGTVKKLSDREAEIMALVAQGLTNAQIGRRLYVSPQTVKTHMEHIFTKLGVKGRAAAVHRAISENLI